MSRLPAGVDLVDAESAGVSANNGIVTANIGTVPASMQQTISYRLRVNQPGVFFTTAQIATANTPDPDSQPNSGTGDGEDDATSTTFRTADGDGGLLLSANPDQQPLPRVVGNQPPTESGKVELSLDMQGSVIRPKVGEIVNLSLTVGNRGGATATNVVVQVLLPTGWVVSNSVGFIINGQTVRGYVNQLLAATRQTLTLPVFVNSSGQVQAQIQEVTEPVSNATPGNGYTNGERDEARLDVRVR